MSASAKPRDFLSEFSRGERRNAARAIAKERKLPFREVWETAYRHRIVQPQPGILGGLMQTVAKLVVRHLGVSNPWNMRGLLMHPTKGWRYSDGLPFGKRAVRP